MTNKDDKIKIALDEFSKEQLIGIIEKFINNKNVREEIINYIESNISQFKKINEKNIALVKFNDLWEEADTIIFNSNLYGGCSDSDSDTVYDNLEEINQLFNSKKLDNDTKKEYIESCISYYHDGNSGFDDPLIDSIFNICNTKEEWLFTISELKSKNKNERYTQSLIMKIYKNHLNDDESYLEMRKQNLEYGMDYYDLVTYYHNKKEYANALKTALEGLEKGKGRIIDLIDYLVDFYNQRNDYENNLKYIIMSFKESPSLNKYKSIKKLCKKEEWNVVSENLYKTLNNDSYTKVKIDYYNKNYQLVLNYIKKSHFDNSDWCSKLEEHFPEEIIKIYNEKAIRLIEEKKSYKYSDALTYCKKIKNMYNKYLHQPEKWNNYLSDLKNKYKNLSALQKLLAKV
jgi:hypothetical protein